MTNYPFKAITDFDDIAVKNALQSRRRRPGKISLEDFMANQRRTSRDNARTPMQWSDASNGGFTTGQRPWLAVNPNYTAINAAEELKNPDSIYHFTQKAIALRKAYSALVYGDYQDLEPDNTQLYAYTRTLGDERFLVLVELQPDAAVDYSLPAQH